ncbi:MAG TPA: ABC transporter substrate-binding protein [Chloroflexota bacterium]
MRPDRAIATLGLLAALLAACASPAAGPAAPAGGAPASAPASQAAPAGRAAPATAAPALLTLRAAYPGPSASLTPIWLAQERGLFREQGVDVELLQLSSVRTDQGVITGDTPLAFGANVVPTRLGGGDIVAIAALTSRISYTLFARPGIASPQELRGKTLVATLPGSTNTSAAILTLRYFGLEPGRDVTIQPSQGNSEQMAIVTQGQADAVLFSPPSSLKAQEAGLVPLANMAEVDIPFMQAAVAVNGAYGRDHAETVWRALRGYVMGVKLARADAEGAKQAIAKYSQTDEPTLLDESYHYYRDQWGRPDFRVPIAGVQTVLQVLDVPGADTAKPEEFVDNSYIDELHSSGFIRQAEPFN